MIHQIVKAACLTACLALAACVYTKSPTGSTITFGDTAGTSIAVPSTPREGLVAAEQAYQAAIRIVGDLLASGKIRPGTTTAQNIGTAIKNARIALDAWQLVPDNRNYEASAVAALGALQRILRNIQ